MQRYRGISGLTIADVYVPESSVAEGVALFLPGFPSTLGDNDVIRAVVGGGMPVVCPHYRGTYDSGGSFTPLSALQSVRDVQRALQNGALRNAKTDEPAILPNRITHALGYSFGAFVLLHAARHLIDLRKIALFSPALTYGPAEPDSGFRETGPDFLAYVRRSRPRTYRLGEMRVWNSLYSGALNYPSEGKSPAAIEVDSYFGARDNSFVSALLEKNHEIIVRHFFPNAARIALHRVQSGGHGIETLSSDFRVERFVGSAERGANTA